MTDITATLLEVQTIGAHIFPPLKPDDVVVRGDYIIASDNNSTFYIEHDCGFLPDLFMFLRKEDLAQTYTTMLTIYSDLFEFRSGMKCINMVHGTSAANINGYIYGTSCVKSIDEQRAEIVPYNNNRSYYWRAGEYEWIAIKFKDKVED